MTTIPNPDDHPDYQPADRTSQALLEGRRFSLRPLGGGSNPKPRRWVVNGLIAEKSLVMIFGPPGSGKSFLALDLLCCVASRLPWMGRDTVPGLTIYVALEGNDAMPHRISAWEAEHGKTTLAFEPYPENIDVRRIEDVDAFIAAANAEAAKLQVEVAAIVFDTVSRAIPGEDENNAAAFSHLVDVSQRIQSGTGAAVIWLHHPSKSRPDDPRGSGALYGACDTVLHVAEEAAQQHSMTVVKQREAEKNQHFRFRLKPTTFKLEGGETGSSCTVEFSTEAVAFAPPKGRAGSAVVPSPTGDLLKLLRALASGNAAYAQASNGGAHFPLPVAEARTAACNQLYSDALSADAKRKRFDRALASLEAIGVFFDESGKNILIPFQENDDAVSVAGDAA